MDGGGERRGMRSWGRRERDTKIVATALNIPSAVDEDHHLMLLMLLLFALRYASVE